VIAGTEIEIRIALQPDGTAAMKVLGGKHHRPMNGHKPGK